MKPDSTFVSPLSAPLSEDEFAALMTQCGADFLKTLSLPVAIGVSGGADSMALAWLVRRWGGKPVVLTVDHGLRPEAAQEAEQVCAWMSALQIPAHILHLEGVGTKRLQERARQHRLRALEEAAWTHGAPVLLLAHHAADQEETLWMRQEAGSGAEGLRGIATASLRGRVMVLRPLLNIRPERLRATLQAAGLSWCEDPSNQNRAFQRVRIRQDLQSFQRQKMWDIQQKAVQAAQGLDRKLALLLAEQCAWQPEGWVQLGAGSLKSGATEAESALSIALLRHLVRLVGGHEYPPSFEETRALLERGEGSLGGACLRRSAKKGSVVWVLVREERGLPESSLKPNVLWANRWRFLGEIPQAGHQVPQSVGPLGRVQASRLRSSRLVPLQALAALPALWSGKELVGLPEGMRSLGSAVSRVPFVWESGQPVGGKRLQTVSVKRETSLEN